MRALIHPRTFAALVVAATETGMVFEDGLQQHVGALLELVNDAVVQGVLVLLQPAGEVVGHLEEGHAPPRC